MAPEGAEPDEDGVTLDAGMPVSTTEGESVGRLALVLVDDDTDEAAFLIVAEEEGGTAGRLVPVEVIDEVDEDGILLDVQEDEFDALPRVQTDRDPTAAEIVLAYRVLGLEEDGDDEE